MTIWTNDLNYEDWKEDLESEYPDSEGYNKYKRYQIMYEINDEYLCDEKISLDMELSNNIVVIGDLELWNGNVQGYKYLGTNLNNIFDGTVGDYLTWYIEDNEVRCTDTYHDGTNRYVYHVLKPNVSQYEFDEYAYDHTLKDAVDKYTESLAPYVKEIYGLEEENEGQGETLGKV